MLFPARRPEPVGEAARIVHGNIWFWKGVERLTPHAKPSMVAGLLRTAAKMPKTSAFSFACTLLLACSGCASASGPWVSLGGERYGVEVAGTEAERARGLMFRDALPAGRGMLFIHEREEPLAYWMKNTHIPLDILFFDHGHHLVAQQRDVPPCDLGNACPPYPSDAPAIYVLELNAGEAERLHLENGATIEFAPDIQTAR